MLAVLAHARAHAVAHAALPEIVCTVLLIAWIVGLVLAVAKLLAPARVPGSWVGFAALAVILFVIWWLIC